MGYRSLVFAIFVACCLAIATGCGSHSNSTRTSAGATSPPPNPETIEEKMAADLQHTPPSQRSRYVALHHNEFMIVMMNPTTRAKVQALLNQH